MIIELEEETFYLQQVEEIETNSPTPISCLNLHLKNTKTEEEGTYIIEYNHQFSPFFLMVLLLDTPIP